MAPTINHGKNKAFSNGIATQADDAKYKQKYKELKAKIGEVEEDNTKLQVKILKSKKAIQRLRVERSILYDRLQSSATPSNPFVLRTHPHLSALSSSDASTDVAVPPTILDPAPYPLANPQGPELYLQELDARKLAAVQAVASGGEWGERPRDGIAGDTVKMEEDSPGPAPVVEKEKEKEKANGETVAEATAAGDGMQVELAAA